MDEIPKSVVDLILQDIESLLEEEKQNKRVDINVI